MCDPTNNNLDSISNPEINKEYLLSGLFTTKVTSTEVALKFTFSYPSSAEALNQKVEVRELKQINLTQVFGAGNEPTKKQCDEIFSNYFDSTKSTNGAMRIKSVSKDLTKTSMEYITAKQDGEVVKLRSVGAVADEIKDGNLIKRIANDGTVLAEPITTPIQTSGNSL